MLKLIQHVALVSPFDGRVAAHFSKSDKFITTFNCDWIPTIDLDVHDTFIREDGTYGADDYIITPQYLSRSFAHIFCIPMRPTAANDYYYDHAYIWDVLSENMLTCVSDDSTRGITEPMVQICHIHLERLDASARHMKFVSDYTLNIIQSKYRGIPDVSPEPIYSLLDKLDSCLTRLSTLSATQSATLYRYTEFRRAWLELAGWYNWYRGLRDRVLDSTLSIHTPVERVMGGICIG